MFSGNKTDCLLFNVYRISWNMRPGAYSETGAWHLLEGERLIERGGGGGEGGMLIKFSFQLTATLFRLNV